MNSTATLRTLNKLAGRYIPANSTAISPPIAALDCIAYFYTAERNGVVKSFAIGYGGKRTKPDFHYSFKDEVAAREYVAKWFCDRAEAESIRAEWRAKAAADKCRTVADVRAKAARNGSISAADTAICLRATLAREFPGVKFSVTSENYSMGCAVRVDWTDGPAENDVDKIADRFTFADFDGMIDLKTSVDRWLAPDGSMSLAHAEGSEGSKGCTPEAIGDPHHPGVVLVTGGAHYVTTSRHLSPALKTELARKVCGKYGVAMPESFADESEFERWANSVRVDGTGPDFTCGWQYLNNLIHRASTGALQIN